ncbi:nicotinamide-nucleotide amidase [Microbacterium endophyticum]|uniref:Nicotinamide-nucleotide amidase n=1 Tax=Microbacterium endophyticum TaxID=1526412 RepID=A0A7W4V3B6_9MICO|nr:CinA family protein [Microbacterium endophyticum]MBB2976062.1 nicotinamide-nucleotide amidase [Microbacterium endophyticum]NIK35019.1 nicotinamide-nucleotide amidase [Microbacterium endophyticum]
MGEIDDLDVETTIVRRKKRRSDAERLLARLDELNWTVATAESLTGGLVAASLVAVPGASAHVRGGIVAYATDVKQTVLGVDATLLELHGAVESKVARQMADKVRDVLADGDTRVDVGIATTGIAGPGSPDGQPVGTVHIAVSTPLGTRVESFVLEGDREAIRAETVRRSLRLALSAL